MAVDANAWISLADARTYLKIPSSDTDDDSLLETLINYSYKALEKYIGHQIISATYTEFYDGDGTRLLVARKWPIISVTSVHVDIERDFESVDLVDSGNYVTDTDNGIIEIFQEEATGPTVFERGIKNVKVIYVAGFAAIPNDVKLAGLRHVAYLYRQENTEGTTSQSLGGKSESYDQKPIPDNIQFLLRPYKDRPV